MNRYATTFLALLLLATIPAPASNVPDDALGRKIRQIEHEYGVRAGIAAVDSAGHLSFRHNADSLFPTASIIKLPVLVTLFRQFDEGIRSRNEMIEVPESSLVPGSGILQYLHPQESLQLVNVAMLMIIMSDNTATNLVIGTLATGHEEQLEAANSTMQKLGITRTRLLNKPYSFATKKRTDEAQRFGIGVTTPDDMAKLLRSVLERKAAHPESCKEMLDILRLQQDRELAARLLPFDEDSTLWIANKTGSLDNVKNDVGVVGSAAGSYLYAIFCDQSEDPGEIPDNRASIAVAEISRALYRHFMRR